jgi:hypothetical protein
MTTMKNFAMGLIPLMPVDDDRVRRAARGVLWIGIAAILPWALAATIWMAVVAMQLLLAFMSFGLCDHAVLPFTANEAVYAVMYHHDTLFGAVVMILRSVLLLWTIYQLSYAALGESPYRMAGYR